MSFFECLPNNQHKLHLLPLEGSLTSLHIETDTRHILASYRPAGRHPTIRHQLCEMISQNISTDPTVINNVCSCNVIHTFHGGRTQTILSKTILQRHPGDMNRLLVCAGDETSNSVSVKLQMSCYVKNLIISVQFSGFIVSVFQYCCHLLRKKNLHFFYLAKLLFDNIGRYNSFLIMTNFCLFFQPHFSNVI